MHASLPVLKYGRLFLLTILAQVDFGNMTSSRCTININNGYKESYVTPNETVQCQKKQSKVEATGGVTDWVSELHQLQRAVENDLFPRCKLVSDVEQQCATGKGSIARFLFNKLNVPDDVDIKQWWECRKLVKLTEVQLLVLLLCIHILLNSFFFLVY